MALKPFLQLVRLPNVFTAAADSLAGWLLVEGTLHSPRQWLPLVGASMATYAGGIVLNDLCDLETDRAERPGRPLPSGNVAVRTAGVLGLVLLVMGMGLAVASGNPRAWVVEAALIACVVGYNAGLKRWAIGPEVMGACRGLNLLMGMSASASFGGPYAWLAAAAYGTFVAGITWVSRSEVSTGVSSSAGNPHPNPLPGGEGVNSPLPLGEGGRRPGEGRVARRNVALGWFLESLAFLAWFAAGSRLGTRSGWWFVPGMMVMGGAKLLVDLRTFAAFRSLESKLVQRAVKTGILSLIWLHVGLLLTVWGPGPALAVGWLWFPAVFSGRWIYST